MYPQQADMQIDGHAGGQVCMHASYVMYVQIGNGNNNQTFSELYVWLVCGV